MNLEFVTAEEAAKWPAGDEIIVARIGQNGRPTYIIIDCFEAEIQRYEDAGWGCFARLPDTLPDLTKENR